MIAEQDLEMRNNSARPRLTQNLLELPGTIRVDYGNGKTVFARTAKDVIFVAKQSGFMKRG